MAVRKKKVPTKTTSKKSEKKPASKASSKKNVAQKTATMKTTAKKTAVKKASAKKTVTKTAAKKTTKKKNTKKKTKTSIRKKNRLKAHLDELSRMSGEDATIARSVVAEILDDDFEPDYDSGEMEEEDTKPSSSTPASTSKALAPTDPVGAYLAEIRKYPLLSREEERALAEKYYDTKDKLLAEALVTSNLRFVVKIAAEYAKFGAKLIDLIQEGNIGLMHAVKEFNPYKGVRLITYAVWWIRGYIQEYLMRQYSMVRIGTTQSQRKLFYQLQKEREKVEQEGLVPTDEILSDRLGVAEKDVRMMTKRLSGRDISLDRPVDGEDSSTTLMDFQSSDLQPQIDEQLSEMELLERLMANIEKVKPSLNERELELLECRLLADEPLTLQEVGDKYGVTREAVRQMEARLMKKIKEVFLEDVIHQPGEVDSEIKDIN